VRRKALEALRKPFFVIALALMALAWLLETTGIPKPVAGWLGSQSATQIVRGTQQTAQMLGADLDEAQVGAISQHVQPTGLGIRVLSIVDGLLLYIVVLMGVSLLIPERIHGRIQGVVTFIVSKQILFAAIAQLVIAIAQLFLMLGLILAFPFGTIVYMIVFGSFARPEASLVLTTGLVLKIGFGIFLVLAHQRFLQLFSLVLVFLSAVMGSIIVSYLHGLVPIFLVNITDAVAGIICAILAVIWAVVFLIGAIISIAKVIIGAGFSMGGALGTLNDTMVTFMRTLSASIKAYVRP
jgi:hypothetical protein